ncbi:alpha/beta fold hydrolase [Taibaiella helva]|uniref:alpha/beta fold hydrolase n=1 Tax=Taibaiella helva TaxID=2301235 RepID=UPI000E56BFEC|nr:alpha/beta hydrolase [Taibaiella helva]
MPYKDHFITTNRINLHYIEYECRKNKPTLLLLHGLTANAHAFDGLVYNGLADHFRVISPDLRGRGHSDKPAFQYGLKHHARDIIGLLDHLGLEKVFIGGHSFGGLLSVYLANFYPDRIEKVIILDAAAEMNPKVPLMLMPVLKRLDRTYPSFEQYLDYAKKAPQNSFWDEVMTTYYRADVRTLPDGRVQPYPNLTKMIKVSIGVANQPWRVLFSEVRQPSLLINGADIYNLGEPILPDFKARESVALLPQGSYLRVDGNHQTMLYGPGAGQIVAGITAFLQDKREAAPRKNTARAAFA